MNLFHYYQPNGRVQHAQTALSEEHAQATADVIGLPFLEGDGNTQGYVRGGKFFGFPEQPSPVHVFDYSVYEWVDPRTMDEHKAATWERIKLARETARAAGVVVPDIGHFDTDSEAITNLTGTKAVLGDLPEDWTVSWTLFDNSVTLLTKETFTIVCLAALAYVGNVHQMGEHLRNIIRDATEIAQLDAIQWPA